MATFESDFNGLRGGSVPPRKLAVVNRYAGAAQYCSQETVGEADSSGELRVAV